MNNRVWIELEKPANDEQGRERAALANKMLERLCGRPISEGFEWNEKRCYYDWGGPVGGYESLVNHGKWFNLDYFGREV